MNTTDYLETEQFKIYSLEAGRFMLDGGAMFGVVPKTLWSRSLPADDKNRIPMAMRCMLIKSKKTGKIYLVDNGSGDKFNEKMNNIYSLDYVHSNLPDSLAQVQVKPEEITDLIFTHLHFDHCGGTTQYDKNGNLIEVFPNANYHVNERHWETAINPNQREKASFFAENIKPIEKSGRLKLVKDHHQFEEGLSTTIVNGHTQGQQLPVITGDNFSLVYAADLIPTFAHVPLPWVMGYDMEPLLTLKEKETFLEQASKDEWYLFLEHDPIHEVITIQKENGKYSMKNSLKLKNIS